MCVFIVVTLEDLYFAVLQHMISEDLPSPLQLTEETLYTCELTAKGVKQGDSPLQGLLLHTHTHTHNHSNTK